MQIEYEATFANINKSKTRKKLKAIGAKLIKPEFFQKRVCFNLPNNKFKKDLAFIRVRTGGGKTTLTYKNFTGNKISDQKELELEIDDFDKAVTLLNLIGCHKKAYQETKRELWRIGRTEITIDTWPFLEPCLEIEGRNEKEVKTISAKLGFDYTQAIFGSIDILYSHKYKIPRTIINQKTPRIVFNEKNPFKKRYICKNYL